MSRCFLNFFKILISWVVRRVKGQKWPETLSFALYISGTMDHMILIYGTHMWKDNIFRCFLHFSQLLIFGVNKWGKRAKNGLKWQYILSVALHIWVSIHHMIMFFVAQVWNDDISRCFFHFFQNFVFLGC